jgi:hypothetical protein
MMRPARAVAFFVAEELVLLRSEAVATASWRATALLLGGLGILRILYPMWADVAKRITQTNASAAFGR